MEDGEAVVDVVASDISRAAYALCPFVNRTIPYELDAGDTPDVQADLQGVLVNGFYDMLVSAKPVGLFNAASYHALGIERRVSYVAIRGYPTDHFAKYYLTRRAYGEGKGHWGRGTRPGCGCPPPFLCARPSLS